MALPDFTTQSGATYKTNIDNRIADLFNAGGTAFDTSLDGIFRGTLEVTGVLTAGSTSAARINTHQFGATGLEINGFGTGNRIAFIDFSSTDVTYTDYGLRIHRGAGDNGTTEILHRGVGVFNIETTEAAALTFSTTNVARLTIAADGGATFTGATTVGSLILADDLTLSEDTNFLSIVLPNSGGNYPTAAGLKLAIGDNLIGGGGKFDIAFINTNTTPASVSFSFGQQTGASAVTDIINFKSAAVVPGSDSAIDLGTTGLRWRNLFTDAMTCGGAAVFSSTTALNGHATLANTKDLLCATDGGSDIGATATRFGTGFFDNLEVTNGIITDTGGTGEAIATKVIEIGNWDMNSSVGGTLTKSNAHGLDYTKIRSVTAIIRNDGITFELPIDAHDSAGTPTGSIDLIDASNIILRAFAGAGFDNSNYNDASSFNRGWIFIGYAL